MGFRRPREHGEIARRWQAFVSGAIEELRSASIPFSVTETKERFDRFLMHGSDAETDFHLDAWSVMDQTQHEQLVRLCAKYLESGLDDPGIGIIDPTRLDALKNG